MIIIMAIAIISLFLIGIFVYYRMRISFIFTFIFIVILIAYSGTFIIREGQQALITQFGEVIGQPFTTPGLYLKIPFIWRVNYFDKRLLLDSEFQAIIPTKDSYFIRVDSVFNWKIVDVTKFINTIGSEKIAQRLLKNIVSGELRESISSLNLIETIRTKTVEKSLKSTFNQDSYLNLPKTKVESLQKLDAKILTGRVNLANNLTRRINKYVRRFGIKVEKVFILDIKYQPVVLNIIYSRMIEDKLRTAAKLRSRGRAEHERIMGETKESYNEIIAPAIQQALLTIGAAEAQEAKIKAESFGQDIDFYNFWRTLNAYKRSLPKGSRGAIFSTDSSFLKLLSNMNPQYQDKDKVKPKRK